MEHGAHACMVHSAWKWQWNGKGTCESDKEPGASKVKF